MTTSNNVFRLLTSCVVITMSFASAKAEGRNAASMGLGNGVLEDTHRDDPSCGELRMHSDGSSENAYAWRYGGVVPPYYGAFAECYQGRETVCAIVLDLTQIGFQVAQWYDLFVWDDDGGLPANVLAMRNDIYAGAAVWPSVSRHRFTLPEVCTNDAWWIGLWGDWPGQFANFYVGADLNGPGGCPMTNIAPGIGYPTGWQSVDLVWGPTAAMGIGAEVQPCAPVATSRQSWGQVKSLYQR